MKPSTKMFIVAGACGIFFIVCLFGLEGNARISALLPGILAAVSVCSGVFQAGNGY